MLHSKNKKISKTKPLFSISIIFLFGLLFSCNENVVSNNEIATETETSDPVSEIEEAFSIVEIAAKPKVSYTELYKSLESKIQYPAEAIKQGIQGKVYIEFIIEKDGSISNHKIVKGIGVDCDNEALRVSKEMDDWLPGKQRGEIVRQKMVLPIKFVLTN